MVFALGMLAVFALAAAAALAWSCFNDPDEGSPALGAHIELARVPVLPRPAHRRRR
jgi:hypothetical protein